MEDIFARNGKKLNPILVEQQRRLNRRGERDMSEEDERMFKLAIEAEDKYRRELVKEYGEDAVLAANDERGVATERLRVLREVRNEAVKAWRALP